VVINDSLSFGSKRFFLVIRQNVAYTLHLNSFDAILVDDSAKTAKQVQVNWKTENEENYTGFEVERSIDDGKTFVGIDSTQSTAAGTYSFLDKSPIIGQTMYRLKLTDISDSSSYSKVALILYALPEKEPVKNTVKVFPNPAQNTINLFIVHTDAPSRSYNITITNASGILVRRVTSTDANWKGNVDDLMPGIYIVRVINNTTNLLVGNAKFLKM
jgi:hypothetical protein